MPYVDSQHVFKARCDQIKIAATTYDALKAKGWDTFGSYAFSVSTNPAQIIDDDFDAKVAVPFLGNAADGQAALLRRLLFESSNAKQSTMKPMLRRNFLCKRLPIAFTALEKKLSPLKIESVLEPSHALINSIAQCLDDGRLRYVDWSKCTSRSAELNNLKEQPSLKMWKADASGTIKQSNMENSLKCDVSTDLEVLNALKRRGIAFELAMEQSGVEALRNGTAGERSPPFLLELFCGSAGVCAQFKTKGGRALGVDHHLKRSKLKAAAVKLDLTQQWVQDLIEREVRLGRADAVHMGPPCGTASRARNIPVRRTLRKRGAPNPRRPAFPLGLPSLRGINKLKVEAANCLYSFSARLAKLCDEHQVLFTIENPERSLMWLTPYFLQLVAKYHFHVIDACMYGSDHRKSTALLANFKAPRLITRCDGQQENTTNSDTGEWSFDTAKEAEYHLPLAREIASAFLHELATRGHLHLQDDLIDHATKVSSEAQPRRSKGPLLLSEFKAKVCVSCFPEDAPPAIIPQNAQPPWQGVPVGSKCLDVHPVSGEEGSRGRLKAVYGVYFSPMEFIEKAKQLKHPFDVPLPLDDANMSSIASILHNGPAKVASYRTGMLNHYINRAKALHSDELALHRKLNKDIQPVMKSKRILLFQEMLSDAGITDATLVDEMCDGFRLVGDLHPSGQLQPQLKPALLSVEQLPQTAIWSQKAVVSSCKKVLEDKEIATAVWQETLEQAADEKRCVWSSTGRQNKGRGRFSQFLVNASVTCHEKIDLEGRDSICATARFFLGAASSEGACLMPGTDSGWSGRISQSWRSGESDDLFGRCLDLKHAYKQLARSPVDSWSSVLAVVNPADAQVYYSEAVALPFGSVSSVLAFNRTARAIRTILARLFKLVVTNFFDDFCQLELGLLRNSAWKTQKLSSNFWVGRFRWVKTNAIPS
eukprot:s735_g6.t1